MLDIQRISKTFNPGTVNEKKAITDLSLHLNKGEFVTVIGSNGAGKSTLFNAIAGSFYVDDGAITVGGHDMTFLPEYKRAKRIGRLFQDPLKGTAPNMTIEENLALAAGNGSWFSRLTQKDRARFRDRLALLDMGLEDRLNQPVGLLSGGQRLELTKRIVAEGNITCLMVTHNMQQALELGTRTLMMADGRIVLDVSGADRAGMTVEDLIHRFKAGTGKTLSNDRMLLS